MWETMWQTSTVPRVYSQLVWETQLLIRIDNSQFVLCKLVSGSKTDSKITTFELSNIIQVVQNQKLVIIPLLHRKSRLMPQKKKNVLKKLFMHVLTDTNSHPVRYHTLIVMSLILYQKVAKLRAS